MKFIMCTFLGTRFLELRNREPFKNLQLERDVDLESDPPEVRYCLGKNVVEVLCDLDETVTTIFLHTSQYKDFCLSEIPFTSSRIEVAHLIGFKPTYCGERMIDPDLGKCGAWDRFDLRDCSIHVQFKYGSDVIELITLMRPDVAP